MDRKTALSPAAERILRGELSVMGADPDDLDRYLAQAQAASTAQQTPEPVSVAAVGADGRFMLLPRPFRLSERISERIRRPDSAVPARSV